MKKMFSFLAVLLLVVSLAVPAYAAGSVSYEGSAKKFIFAPGSRFSPTDLFSDFKNVMPGDKRTEQIVIQNKASNKVKIRLYMRSLGAQENTDDFLSQMKLTVDQVGDSILFAAPADRTAQLSGWTYLGTVYSGGKITLNVTLEVPITMGNAYAHDLGYVDWQFKVEELPISPDDPQPPRTGDDRMPLVWGGVMILSLTALAVLLFLVRRRRNRNSK